MLARRCRIGLLGGSFNPAHRGHLALSQAARILLGLDEVWWLVSPANPLKDPADLAPLGVRVLHARHLTRKTPFIRVLTIEAALGTRYTAAFLDSLLAMRRRSRFLWLAGMDILQSWRRWRRPTDVAGRIPLAVFARPPYFWPGLHGWFATRYRDRQVMATARRSLIDTPPPAWTFLRPRLPRESATALRRRLGPRWWEAVGAPDEEAF
ncbi:MAG: nicotinic acid mononucleotide adenylyltransferase [Alphaproteobacteria bacterium]|nr:MAG: nicotinic acid mononucleotide adenylyltransferase [Alphaproteobacteria bacterium]